MPYHMNLRRYRQNQVTRDLFDTHSLQPKDIIAPIFVQEGLKEQTPIKSISNLSYHNEESTLKFMEEGLEKGIRSYLLFVFPKDKKESAFSYQCAASTIEHVKKRFGQDIILSTDVCLCPYTQSGHCGFVHEDKKSQSWYIDNHSSVLELSKMALELAEAGVDMIAPSDIFDDRIKAIRETLDQNGYDRTLIMSYSTKFSSAFYGPFRDVLNSHPEQGDRKSHQISPFNLNDAIRSSLRDAEQGADILMIKPAGYYLDLAVHFKNHPQLKYYPLAAYQVGGEIQALRLLAQHGLGNFQDLYRESLVSMKRAGIDQIITYGALEIDFFR